MMRCHDAVRIIFDIDEADAEELRRLAYREHTSRAAQVRMAVRTYLEVQARSALHRTFGQWPEAPDGCPLLATQRDGQAE